VAKRLSYTEDARCLKVKVRGVLREILTACCDARLFCHMNMHSGA